MRYRQLGRSGLTVSPVALGCIEFGRRVDAAQARRIVDAALEAGITFIDTAEGYGDGESERMLGEILGSRRQQVVISTKFGGPRLRTPDMAAGSRRNMRRAVEQSLRRLQTEYIDLYQLHYPDPKTPLEETLAAMDELVKEGKIRYIGGSNFSASELVESQWFAQTTRRNRLISVTREYALTYRVVEAEVVPVCVKYGIGLLPWRPIAFGLLTGRYRRGDAPPPSTNNPAPTVTSADWDRIEALERFGQERGVDALAVAIGGLAAMPAVSSVIVGATRPEQAIANAKAAEWLPTAEDVAGIRAILGTSIRLGES